MRKPLLRRLHPSLSTLGFAAFRTSALGMSSLGMSALGILALGACSSGSSDGTGGAGTDGGTGGALGTGGSSGGTTSTGGTTGSGSNTGAGGTSSGGGGTGGDGAGGTGGSAVVDCASLPVCDDFDSATVGMAPDAATWGVVLDYGGNGPASNVAVDTTDAHSAPNAVKVEGSTGIYGITIDDPGASFHLRAWMKTVGAAGAPALVGVGTSPDAEVRVRLKTGFVTANIVPGDGVAPAAAPTGTCAECTTIPSDWFCVQVHADHATQTFTVSIDGDEAVSVTGNAGWHTSGTWPASFDVLRLGVMALEGSGGTLYIDDVALGSAPIPCE